MGVDFPEQEESVKKIRELDDVHRGWLGHHLRNSLFNIDMLNQLGKKEEIKEVIEHMKEDLRMFGL